jgi:tetraacyldisaccharide 4'-kinase
MPDAGYWNRVWYGGATNTSLRPLAWLFGSLSALRRAGYASGVLRRTRLTCPIVVVGNLSVGGTGKTPLVIWLARQLRNRGIKVGIASRGYGGAAVQPQLVDDASDPRQVGDEPLLMQRRAGAPVCVCHNRVRAAQMLIDAGCELVICDDGLQHYALRRDCEIAVVDGMRGLGNGLLLPAGPLREGPWRLLEVDLVVVNGAGGAALPELPQPPLAMQLRGGEVHPLQAGLPIRPLAELRGLRVHAVAGIGNPQRFFALLRDAGLELIEHPFADHHEFRAQDIRFDDQLPVLMTEKDAVKCSAMADARHGYLPVEASFGAADEQRLLERVAGLLASGGR